MKPYMKSRICSFAMATCFATSMVGETLAYNWSQTLDTTNEFQPGIYTTLLEEDFVAPNDWTPGQYTNKDVWVNNEGTVPVFAKLELSQEWIRVENTYDLDGNPIAPLAGETIPLVFEGDDGLEYAALINWGEDVVMLEETAAANLTGLDLDIPTVSSLEEAAGKWLLLEVTDDGNLVFYYMGVIEAGETSPWLVDGVEMNSQIQAAILEVHTVWNKTDAGWESITTTVQNHTHDYENARYTLNVSMTTVQATSDAVLELFGSDLVSEQTIVSYLQYLSTTGVYSRDDSVTEKKLYLSQANGTLTYIPDSPDENWFLSYLNMMPGESYTDTLLIENETAKTYALYMQAILKDSQSELAEELLDYITITVTYNGEVIYQGSAAGVDVDDTLFEVIPLGDYSAGETNQIDVTVTLDKDLPMEYAGVLATTDWQFMVIDNSGGSNRKPSTDPDPDPDPEEDPDTDPDGDPDTDPDSDPDSDPDPDPSTDIPDGDIPRGDMPDSDSDPDYDPSLDILDPNIPLDWMPQTGDISNLMRYVITMLISGVGFLFCLMKIKESYKQEQ